MQFHVHKDRTDALDLKATVVGLHRRFSSLSSAFQTHIFFKLMVGIVDVPKANFRAVNFKLNFLGMPPDPHKGCVFCMHSHCHWPDQFLRACYGSVK